MNFVFLSIANCTNIDIFVSLSAYSSKWRRAWFTLTIRWLHHQYVYNSRLFPDLKSTNQRRRRFKSTNKIAEDENIGRGMMALAQLIQCLFLCVHSLYIYVCCVCVCVCMCCHRQLIVEEGAVLVRLRLKVESLFFVFFWLWNNQSVWLIEWNIWYFLNVYYRLIELSQLLFKVGCNVESVGCIEKALNFFDFENFYTLIYVNGLGNFSAGEIWWEVNFLLKFYAQCLYAFNYRIIE